MDLSHLISAELRLRYLERRKQDLELLIRAVKSNNFEVFKVIGHQIKGNAPTFGHADLSLIAQKCEEAGIKEDRELAHQALCKFSHWLESVDLKSRNATG